MTLPASTYFEHLKAYVNNAYVVDDGAGGKVTLVETYFRADELRPRKRRIELRIPGLGFAFKLDHDDFEDSKAKAKTKEGEKSKPPLFHFLDDTGKAWSKRCDFVVFWVNRKTFHADCIEFKSKSLAKDKIVPQLKAGECWCRSLKHTIEHYTGDKRRIVVRKFVFADNEAPEAYLAADRQLRADPSIRYYHFDEVNGQSLADLVNPSILEI
jgi:hypothetical protein